MGNLNSAKSRLSAKRTPVKICEDIPDWSSEMWTPNLSVSLSSDSRHVVLKYRTNGTETIEFKTTGTDPNIARELIEFGKSLHNFSSAKNGLSKNIFPAFTVFLNNCDASSHYHGFVEIGVARQVKTEDEIKDGKGEEMIEDQPKITFDPKPVESMLLSSLESSPAHPDFRTGKGVVCDEMVPTKNISVRRHETSEHVSRQIQKTTASPKAHDAMKESNSATSSVQLDPESPKTTNCTRRAHTFPEKDGKIYNAKGSSIRAFSHGLTVSDIRDFRRKKRNEKSPVSKADRGSKESLSTWTETQDKQSAGATNALGATGNSQILCDMPENPNADSQDDGGCKGDSESESTLTPPTEVELSDNEVTLRRCALELAVIKTDATNSENKSTKDVKKTTSTEITLERPGKGSLITQRTTVDDRKPNSTPGKEKRHDEDKNPRQEAWLAFVRTLKHHDEDTCSETSLSDFSNYDVERNISISSSEPGMF